MKTRMLMSLALILLTSNVYAYTVAFGGELKIDGREAGEGTEVVAKIGDIEIGSHTIENEGAYMITVEKAENYLYKYVDLYVNGERIDVRIMLKEERFRELNINIKVHETTTTTTSTTIPHVGVIGQIIEYSASHYAAILGLILVLILIASALRETRR